MLAGHAHRERNTHADALSHPFPRAMYVEPNCAASAARPEPQNRNSLCDASMFGRKNAGWRPCRSQNTTQVAVQNTVPALQNADTNRHVDSTRITFTQVRARFVCAITTSCGFGVIYQQLRCWKRWRRARCNLAFIESVWAVTARPSYWYSSGL